MKSSLLLGLFGLCCTSVVAATGAADHDGFVLTPEQMKPASTDGKRPQAQIIHTDDNCRIVTKRVHIPANTDLPPHGHEQGYRLVTVISGTLQLGFGKKFDEKRLQELPPGSVFSEPAGHLHFARTGAEPVVLQLTEVDGKKPDSCDADGAIRHSDSHSSARGHGHNH